MQLAKDKLPKQMDFDNALELFLQSRSEGISNDTLRDYRGTLGRSLFYLGLAPSTARISEFLSSLPCSIGGKYGYYKCLRAFYNWLYSPRAGLGYKPENNPITWVEAPKRPKLILPSLSKEQVLHLIERADNNRDKAIIALFTESGLRKAELTNIKTTDIDWMNHCIRVLGKGQKEAFAPFGQLSERYIKEWLTEFTPNGENIWGLNHWGIAQMLRRLKDATGLPCNPHTFRRTFACLLRKQGIDSMTIKDLGRWESIEMVQRYTRTVTFHDSLKFYKSPITE